MTGSSSCHGYIDRKAGVVTHAMHIDLAHSKLCLNALSKRLDLSVINLLVSWLEWCIWDTRRLLHMCVMLCLVLHLSG